MFEPVPEFQLFPLRVLGADPEDGTEQWTERECDRRYGRTDRNEGHERRKYFSRTRRGRRSWTLRGCYESHKVKGINKPPAFDQHQTKGSDQQD